MNPTAEQSQGQERYSGPSHGIVREVADPEGLHRIRAEIPGYIELTAWAYPITAGGGSPKRGGHVVPGVGSDVVIWFINGEKEFPIYACGWWGAPDDGSEMPADADVEAEPEKVQTMQIGDMVITLDERERDDDAGTGQFFIIEHKPSGDQLMYDLAKNGWQMKGSYLIRLICDGIISIEAAQVQINGRRVMDFPRPM